MRKFGKLTAASAFGLLGTGAATLPAAASSLAVNFTSAPTALVASGASPGEQVYGYGYQFTASSNETITALGTFDNGALANLGNDNVANGGNPLVKTGAADHPGDTVALYAGTIPNAGNPGGSLNGLTPIASVVVGGTTTGGSQVGLYWAFKNLASSVSLTSGDSYFIVTIGLVNFDPIAAYPSPATANGVILNTVIAENCQAPDNCSLAPLDDPGIFGPNLQIDPTPLPATLPLFAGGLSLLGFFGRRKKQKASAAIAAA
jgi:hypothetical protein